MGLSTGVFLRFTLDFRGGTTGGGAHWDAVIERIRYGISNFEPPNESDPAQVQIDPPAKEMGVANLERFIDQIETDDNHDFKAYAARLRTALEAYIRGGSLLPTYVFISTQDGFLGYLCDDLEVDPEETYYEEIHKERALKDAYPVFFGSKRKKSFRRGANPGNIGTRSRMETRTRTSMRTSPRLRSSSSG